jgi:cystathionine gamma-lyase
MNKKSHTATKVVHAGLANVKQGEALMQGPAFASTFHLSGDVDVDTHTYGRFHNPTWDALEAAIGELEEGRVLVFPSGMAAGAAVMTSFVESGDTILLASDGYSPSLQYADSFLKKFGVKIHTVPTLEIPQQNFKGIKIVYLESPSNPLLDIVDIEKLAEKAHSHGAILAIDNTTSTPLGQQPLKLNADISVCSDTKAMNGHSDVVFGHVATQNDELYEKMMLWRKLSGNIPGPMETWLVHRGLATLDMRLERMNNNAQQIAEFLSRHKKVKSIRYPGLKTDPSHYLAKQQMNQFGFIISFDLGSQQNADLFLNHSKLLFEATSFGGIHTMAERRARWPSELVAEGLIRLSVGCENIDDLIDDIESSLNSL